MEELLLTYLNKHNFPTNTYDRTNLVAKNFFELANDTTVTRFSNVTELQKELSKGTVNLEESYLEVINVLTGSEVNELACLTASAAFSLAFVKTKFVQALKNSPIEKIYHLLGLSLETVLRKEINGNFVKHLGMMIDFFHHFTLKNNVEPESYVWMENKIKEVAGKISQLANAVIELTSNESKETVERRRIGNTLEVIV